ncbi:hypothetical protein LCGC14_2871140 [marine sediment metagenome]|uniref:Uncharacterized protein n=1 Tax=marine sediment metagenome TaxID=412755 RepID=A0A0F9AU21_9ZZZZ
MTVWNTLRILLFVSCGFCVGGLQAGVPEMSPQKMQDPVQLNPKTINCLLAVYAMRTPGISEMTVAQIQPADKRFWLQNVGGDMKVAWNVSAADVGEYRPTFVVNCSEGTEITVTGPNDSLVFRAPEGGWQRCTSQDDSQAFKPTVCRAG